MRAFIIIEREGEKKPKLRTDPNRPLSATAKKKQTEKADREGEGRGES
jgi:hypothetical protein